MAGLGGGFQGLVGVWVLGVVGWMVQGLVWCRGGVVWRVGFLVSFDRPIAKTKAASLGQFTKVKSHQAVGIKSVKVTRQTPGVAPITGSTAVFQCIIVS